MHQWTFSTCLPYFLDYRIFVISTLLPIFNLFFQGVIFALFQVFNSFLRFFSLNASKSILVNVELWFKSTYIVRLNYLSLFFPRPLRQEDPRDIDLISHPIKK